MFSRDFREDSPRTKLSEKEQQGESDDEDEENAKRRKKTLGLLSVWKGGLDKLPPLLEGKPWFMREAAAKSVSLLSSVAGESNVIRALVELWGDPSSSVRRQAVEAIKTLGAENSPYVVQELLKLLSDEVAAENGYVSFFVLSFFSNLFELLCINAQRWFLLCFFLYLVAPKYFLLVLQSVYIL